MLTAAWLTLTAILAPEDPGAPGAAAPERPPNVVLIVGDDQGHGDYGFQGHPLVRTPRLDRLASEGMVFSRGYVASPICRPSLGSLVTGLPPHRTGITSTEAPWPRRAETTPEEARDIEEIADCMAGRIDGVRTVPRALRGKGYASFQAGKWWEGGYRRGGFTHGMTTGARRGRQAHGDRGLAIGRETMQPVLDFLDDVQDRPFFLWFAPLMPHLPHDPPEEILAHYEGRTASPHVARYLAMCEWFDRVCGELLDALDERGLGDDTLVLFLNDNGWVQRLDSPLADPRSKGSALEGGVRTPIVLRWRGRIEPGRDDHTPVSALDVPATILAACGVDGDLPGLDLRDPRALAEREAVLGAVYDYRVADPFEPTRSLAWIYVVEGRWKLLVPARRPGWWERPALFDLAVDPGEAHDVAGLYPEAARRLRAHVDAWWPEGGAVTRHAP